VTLVKINLYFINQFNQEFSMEKKTQQFEFQGQTGEFFKIWIVNLMLSIVTLGIYSAWAKVRTRKYFYSNTLLMNTPFDYLADPIKILKGRLFALALILIYSFSAVISPVFQGIIILIFIPLFPWIIIKALKFNLYNSAYRNIRFHFNADYLKALWIFIGLPLVVGLSVGLAYPYFVRERKKFVLDHSAYGTSKFELSATTSQFYSVYLKFLALMMIIGLLITSIYYSAQFGDIAGIMLLPALLLIYPAFMLIYIYLYTTITNLSINNTTIDQYHFESHLETVKLCWLYFTNMLAIMFSFGLLIPWAMIRTARYRISCLVLLADSEINTFIAAEAERADAIGEELGDILDIDVGL